MADGGGARPESERGRGFRWPEALVRARGVVGKGVALERGVRRGVGDRGADGRSACFEPPVGDAAEREKGRERGGGCPAAGVLRSAGVSWGLAPTSGRHPAAARAHCA
jgi:hypothetical protein